MQHVNEYSSMLMHKLREQELMEQAEKNRMAAVVNSAVRRVRQTQRVIQPKNNG